MGYSLIIGEKRLGKRTEYDEAVLSLSSSDCPDFIDSEQESTRLPSYTGWSEFCEEVGLTHLFYKKILKSHPGIYKLTAQDLALCIDAKKIFLNKNPNAKLVTFDQFPESFRHLSLDEREQQTDDLPKENWTLNRLEWLCFWIDYALKNCKNPSFANS